MAPSSFSKNEAVSAKTLHFLCSHRGWPCSNGHLSSGLRAEFGIPIPKEIINQRILLINIDLFFWNTFLFGWRNISIAPLLHVFSPSYHEALEVLGPGRITKADEDLRFVGRPQTLCGKLTNNLDFLKISIDFLNRGSTITGESIGNIWYIYISYIIYRYIIYIYIIYIYISYIYIIGGSSSLRQIYDKRSKKWINTIKLIHKYVCSGPGKL